VLLTIPDYTVCSGHYVLVVDKGPAAEVVVLAAPKRDDIRVVFFVTLEAANDFGFVVYLH
jgi:hypothetical protein